VFLCPPFRKGEEAARTRGRVQAYIERNDRREAATAL